MFSTGIIAQKTGMSNERHAEKRNNRKKERKCGKKDAPELIFPGMRCIFFIELK